MTLSEHFEVVTVKGIEGLVLYEYDWVFRWWVNHDEPLMIEGHGGMMIG